MFFKIAEQAGWLCITDKCNSNVTFCDSIYRFAIGFIKAGIAFHFEKDINIQTVFGIFVFKDVMSLENAAYFVVNGYIRLFFVIRRSMTNGFTFKLYSLSNFRLSRQSAISKFIAAINAGCHCMFVSFIIRLLYCSSIIACYFVFYNFIIKLLYTGQELIKKTYPVRNSSQIDIFSLVAKEIAVC